jgi:cleavage and polyadenylation specificity factor subunit 1
MVPPGAHGGEGQWRAVRPPREPLLLRERLLNPRNRCHPISRLFACAHFSPSLLEHSYRPYPDAGQFGTRTPKGDITITTRVQGVTVGAAPFFQGTAILHVLSNAIRVLEPGTLRQSYTTWSDPIRITDGTERQIIKDMEGNNQRPKIKYCSICDPFVFILREDDTIGLFIGEPERGKIRRKDMSPMGEKVRRFDVPICLSGH